MKHFYEKADKITLLLLYIGPWTICVVLVLLLGLLRTCVPQTDDPLDRSINKNTEIVKHLMVLDPEHCGFRVVYRTKDAVTKERFEEITHRPSIRQRFKSLQHDAPIHFGGSLFETDICDFANYVREYPISKDLLIHNIFVAGKKKMLLYVQPNPNLPNCATWMNFSTEQGNQYLSEKDINLLLKNGMTNYRYWKCSFLLQQSDTDERFSHFTEQERLF